MALFSFNILPPFLSLKCKLQEQQETIDSIENNIESAQVNVQEGTRQLGKVSCWKTLETSTLGSTADLYCCGMLLISLHAIQTYDVRI